MAISATGICTVYLLGYPSAKVPITNCFCNGLVKTWKPQTSAKLYQLHDIYTKVCTCMSIIHNQCNSGSKVSQVIKLAKQA